MVFAQLAFDAFRGVDLIFHAGDIHEFYVLDELERIASFGGFEGDSGGGWQPGSFETDNPDAPDLALPTDSLDVDSWFPEGQARKAVDEALAHAGLI